MVEDTLLTALRGAEGGMFVPTGRGALEVASTEKASWHFKVMDKASNNGCIFIGVEATSVKDGQLMFLGQDWFHSTCIDEYPAYYYSSDGDLCWGNQVVRSTGCTYGNGDVINIQLHDSSLTFTKNNDPVGNIENIKGFVRIGVQLHRPGDKILLLKELTGAGAVKDIRGREEYEVRTKQKKAEEERRVAANKQQALEEEQARLAFLEEQQRQKEEEETRAKEMEEERLRREEEVLALEAIEEEKRRVKIEEERLRLLEIKRAREKEAEAARKAAAQEQIQKIARSRGGYTETQDPDAPTEKEIQAYIRGCLPLRYASARQMGMTKLPGVTETAAMRLTLTPQQHHAIKEHLTNLKRRAKASPGESSPQESTKPTKPQSATTPKAAQ
eukprot:CAMPEP_0180216956 /NCGR_PEP_ID=MMETSP0987-20121128/16608_1 /TAXON_ID=697907 /ORGANISM="non described non described, Strain CCMP2293" /LENGTH=386 /DNA_ID=CAMNT_0022176321 /DNA_START=9 /DNA_END=1169 /DNA_ORIENTATION=-